MEQVLLVGANLNDGEDYLTSLEELGALAEACDMEVAGGTSQTLETVHKAFYIGTGKVDEVKGLAQDLGADVIIFDNSLSPMQMRNLQERLEKPILDRSALILDIFARRARSREAKLQVEVARLQYMLPRLVGLHAALSRQGGASGSMSSRGAGEKKLELDRRRLEQRLTTMRRELEKISGERETQRKKRAASGIPRVALVGYTNAGKSTVMNAMLSAYDGEGEKMVYEEDMLFATLDTTVRRITPPDQNDFLLSDTVGFISNLPHNLVKAFRSTLEEVREADLLIQVIDYSDENYTEHIRVTEETLKELGAERIPMIYAYNKADLCGMGTFATIQGDDRLYLSAKSQSGIDALMTLISGKLSKRYQDCAFIIPYQRGDVVSYLNDNAVVHCTEYREDGVYMETNVSRIDAARYEQFLVNCYERLPSCE